jgi:hypothetical protein
MIETEAKAFEIGDRTQMYMTETAKIFEHTENKPAINFLPVKGKDQILLKYTIGNINFSIKVAE